MCGNPASTWQWDTNGMSPAPGDAGPMSGGNSPDGSAYFAVLDSTSTIWLWSLGEFIYAANGGTVAGIRNSDAVVLWNQDGTGVNGSVLGISADPSVLAYGQTAEATFGGNAGVVLSQAVSLLWAGWPPNSVDLNVGWVAQVQTAAAEAQEMTNWRTQLTVLDANSTAVAGVQVMVTPDREIGICGG